MRTLKGWIVSSSSAKSGNCELAYGNIATAPDINSVGTIHGFGASYRKRQIPFRLCQSGPRSFGAAFGTVSLSTNRHITRHAASHPTVTELLPNRTWQRTSALPRCPRAGPRRRTAVSLDAHRVAVLEDGICP